MSAFQAIVTSLRKSFTFSGRATRSEFWWFQAFRLAVALGLTYQILLVLVAFISSPDNTPEDLITQLVASNGIALCITTSLVLILLPASYSVSVRRLHDRGYQGWPLWIVFIAAMLLVYTSLLLIIIMIITPHNVLEGTQLLVAFLGHTSDTGKTGLDALMRSGTMSAFSIIFSIIIFISPLYYIFFLIQSCLPSIEAANRYGRAPNTPSDNEVPQ